MEDIDYVVECIKKIVARLRSMSPLYEDFIGKRINIDSLVGGVY